MSDIDNEDILEDIAHLAHLKRMRKAWKARERELEAQGAHFGSSVPPHIPIEIQDLRDWIKEASDEIARLQSESVIDKEPFGEVELRMLIAEAWNTPHGRISVVGRTSIEFHRIRLGISVEKCLALETDIRKQLAEEVFSEFDMQALDLSEEDAVTLQQGKFREISPLLIDGLRRVGRAAQLDVETTVKLLRVFPYTAAQLVSPYFRELLVDANNAWNREQIRDTLSRFYGLLRENVAEDEEWLLKSEDIDYDNGTPD